MKSALWYDDLLVRLFIQFLALHTLFNEIQTQQDESASFPTESALIGLNKDCPSKSQFYSHSHRMINTFEINLSSNDVIIPRLYCLLRARARAYQATAGLTSSCPKTEVKHHPGDDM